MIGCVMANYLFRSEREKAGNQSPNDLHNVWLQHGLYQGEKK